MISDYAPCNLCGGVVHHHVSCVRFRHYHDDDGTKAKRTPRLHPPFHVGETLILRDQTLRCYDVLVELRATDRDVAVVMLHGYSEIVPLTSLRRVGDTAPLPRQPHTAPLGRSTAQR